ncbi:acyl-CoA N-acyltransferase [Stachybotrys elegans]|uniref:Acyl-CoA N-acyltransferase n=1 Tax=Stachybotrys elegans TaxID=80388 RepID=A0A8K0SY73_9HYPO|nr:acyl-CoA N-acyltransferase [Stachybotrys elegans]
MGTPFIALLEPINLEGYQPGAPAEAQPASVPQTFLDAMEVRNNVFVQEQKVPAENEFDADDSRSCHWVIYASVNKTDEAEVRDDDGNVLQPRKSSTRSTPIGTVRIVPFPHAPHPQRGGHYWNNILTDAEGKSLEPSDGVSDVTFATDRATTFHDGREPYVKVGRLAVVKEFRKHGIARLLVGTALAWLKENPSYFDPSITELGLEQMGASSEKEVPKWNGLVCAHAQEAVAGAWQKMGFQVDEGMGTWWEEGMAHIGMFQRLDIGPKDIKI